MKTQIWPRSSAVFIARFTRLGKDRGDPAGFIKGSDLKRYLSSRDITLADLSSPYGIHRSVEGVERSIDKLSNQFYINSISEVAYNKTYLNRTLQVVMGHMEDSVNDLSRSLDQNKHLRLLASPEIQELDCYAASHIIHRLQVIVDSVAQQINTLLETSLREHLIEYIKIALYKEVHSGLFASSLLYPSLSKIFSQELYKAIQAAAKSPDKLNVRIGLTIGDSQTDDPDDADQEPTPKSSSPLLPPVLPIKGGMTTEDADFLPGDDLPIMEPKPQTLILYCDGSPPDSNTRDVSQRTTLRELLKNTGNQIEHLLKQHKRITSITAVVNDSKSVNRVVDILNLKQTRQFKKPDGKIQISGQTDNLVSEEQLRKTAETKGVESVERDQSVQAEHNGVHGLPGSLNGELSLSEALINTNDSGPQAVVSAFIDRYPWNHSPVIFSDIYDNHLTNGHRFVYFFTTEHGIRLYGDRVSDDWLLTREGQRIFIQSLNAEESEALVKKLQPLIKDAGAE